MQSTQSVSWLKTMKAHLLTLHHADRVMEDIKFGKTSVYAAVDDNVSRYSLAEAFNLQGKPESLTAQTLVCLIPERIRASQN